jgi:hypothetical protein
MTNSIPAITLKGTNSATLPNSSTIRPSQSPAKMLPQREDAPAQTLMPVRDRDPPVPIDWKKLPLGLPSPPVFPLGVKIFLKLF